MGVARIVTTCSLVIGIIGCAAAPGDPAENRKDEPKPTLWESDRSVLFPALREFVHAPGTKLDRQFVPLEKQKNGTLLFKKVPGGWFTWKDGISEGRVIVLDQDGFRVLIRLEHVPDVEKELINHIQNGQSYGSVVLIDHLFASGGAQVARVVKCSKGKGETNFTEHRYFNTGKGAICVELTVFDMPQEKRTLEHLLAHLRSLYGKYEGVCQEVEEVVFAKR